MYKKLNLKFLGLFFFYLIIAIIFKQLFSYFAFDEIYFDFMSGLLVPPMIFYLMVSFDPQKHEWSQLLFLILGYFLFQILISENYDIILFIKLFGIMLSVALCSVTFIRNIKNWFISKK